MRRLDEGATGGEWQIILERVTDERKAERIVSNE
jgi:hypothetical protein